MHVLLEMVKKDISIQQLPQIGPVLIPEMYRILTLDSVSVLLLYSKFGGMKFFGY
jgi:hypothetical protein